MFIVKNASGKVWGKSVGEPGYGFVDEAKKFRTHGEAELVAMRANRRNPAHNAAVEETQ